MKVLNHIERQGMVIKCQYLNNNPFDFPTLGLTFSLKNCNECLHYNLNLSGLNFGWTINRNNSSHCTIQPVRHFHLRKTTVSITDVLVYLRDKKHLSAKHHQQLHLSDPWSLLLYPHPHCFWTLRYTSGLPQVFVLEWCSTILSSPTTTHYCWTHIFYSQNQFCCHWLQLYQATAARISELHILDITQIMFWPGPHAEVRLGLMWDFIAKKQLPGESYLPLPSLCATAKTSLHPDRQGWLQEYMLRIPSLFNCTPTSTPASNPHEMRSLLSMMTFHPNSSEKEIIGEGFW